MNQPLVALASPDPSLTQAQSRHTQSELVTFLAQGRSADPSVPRIRQRNAWGDGGDITAEYIGLSDSQKPCSVSATLWRVKLELVSLLRRALMKANIAPCSGSCWITSRAKIARPSIC